MRRPQSLIALVVARQKIPTRMLNKYTQTLLYKQDKNRDDINILLFGNETEKKIRKEKVCIKSNSIITQSSILLCAMVIKKGKGVNLLPHILRFYSSKWLDHTRS